MKTLDIKNNRITIPFSLDDTTYKTYDVLINIQDGGLIGLYRLDYILQIVREYHGLPSKMSIAKKLKSKKMQEK